MKSVIKLTKENSDKLVLSQLSKESEELGENNLSYTTISTKVKDGMYSYRLFGTNTVDGKSRKFKKALSLMEYEKYLTKALNEMHYEVEFIAIRGTNEEDLNYFANVRGLLYEKNAEKKRQKQLHHHTKQSCGR